MRSNSNYIISFHNSDPIYLHKECDSNKLQKITNLIDAVFEDYSKVMAIRIDFYIQSEYSMWNNYEAINSLFVKLRNYSRSNSLFNHYITYIAKLEYSHGAKWHYHVLFLFDGQHVKNDAYIAMELGRYWNAIITNGKGYYYSANLNKRKYDDFLVKDGLGTIDYYDSIKRKNLISICSYLSKADPILDVPGMLNAAGRAYRSLRIGQYRPKTTNYGRKRSYDDGL